MPATVVLATAATAITALTATATASNLANKYGMLLRNINQTATANTVPILVGFDASFSYGSFSLNPGDALRIDPADAINTANVWTQAADGATVQQIECLVTGARGPVPGNA